MVAELRDFAENGGEALFGTDAGYMDHFDTAMEYSLMEKSGMTFAQILAALTINPAHRFGKGHQGGRISAGEEADLTVTEADPAKDVTALSKVWLTMRHGQAIYSKP